MIMGLTSFIGFSKLNGVESNSTLLLGLGVSGSDQEMNP